MTARPLLCVGLDPHVQDLESPRRTRPFEFCLRIVMATAPYAAAFKPNAAFFEALGPEGWTVLKAVIDAVPYRVPAARVAHPRHPGCQARVTSALDRRSLRSLGL